MQGVPLVLTQKVGEVTVKLRSAGRAEDFAEALTAANGARLHRDRALPRGLGMFKLESDSPARAGASKAALDSLNADNGVEYALPVYADAATGLRHLLNDEIVVCLKAPADAALANSLASVKLRIAGTLSTDPVLYVLKLAEPKGQSPFRVCEWLRQQPGVVWEEPNAAQEIQVSLIPNDSLFGGYQWNLRNTGQTLGFADADVDGDDAWDASQGVGSPGIRIAILDCGVQTSHPDLDGSIVAGYDFYSGDADANPGNAYDVHGTAVAGVAAAEINNSTGIAGVSGVAKILPVRISSTQADGSGQMPDVATVYRAIVYAADNADVLNISWGTSFNGTIYSALTYAYYYGRAGKGCAVLCAAGNSAGGSGDNSLASLHGINLYSLGAGNYYVYFLYEKDGSGSANDDCFWLADVWLPNGTPERFDTATLPAGWQAGGNANWAGSLDPVHAHGTTRYAWRSGAIGDGQQSWLRTPLLAVNSSQTTLSYRRWISSQINSDYAYALVYDSSMVYRGGLTLGSGAPDNRETAVSFPANQPTVLGVGSTGDFDYRSHFSQYDSTLDFVAPGGGGYAGIATTDRTGNDGYVAGDYVLLEGTSFSSPTAAGIAALVYARNGNQTRATVADKLIQTCDKVGPVAYSGSPSRNDYYGHGRLNANAAVTATTADTTRPTFTSAKVMHHQAVDVAFSEPMGDGVLTPANYSITAGAGTLGQNPAKVIRITPSAYRLIWTAGAVAESGTVTIAAASSIKDVAGNLLYGTLSRNSTGTKRIIAINGGSPYGTQGVGNYYAPPFVSDNGFQGNEPYPVLTLTSGMNAQYWFDSSVDLSGVVNPAPMPVYQTSRVIYYDYYGQVISYAIPVPAGSYTLRLHFCQNYWNDVGDERFDIYVNGSAQWYMLTSWLRPAGRSTRRTSPSGPVSPRSTVTSP